MLGRQVISQHQKSWVFCLDKKMLHQNQLHFFPNHFFGAPIFPHFPTCPPKINFFWWLSPGIAHQRTLAWYDDLLPTYLQASLDTTAINRKPGESLCVNLFQPQKDSTCQKSSSEKMLPFKTASKYFPFLEISLGQQNLFGWSNLIDWKIHVANVFSWGKKQSVSTLALHLWTGHLMLG